MSRDLPEFPNLDHLKKQAKALLRRFRQGKPGAKLTEAQHAVAREYGFASWAKLKAHIDSLPRPADTAPPTAGQFARYTEKARQTLFFARYWAAERGSRGIEPEHLLLGLMQADAALLNCLLRRPAALESLQDRIALRAPIHERLPAFALIPLSSACRRTLDQAVQEADRLQHQQVSTGHFMLGFLHDEGSPAVSILSSLLTEQGTTLDAVRNDVVRLLNETS